MAVPNGRGTTAPVSVSGPAAAIRPIFHKHPLFACARFPPCLYRPSRGRRRPDLRWGHSSVGRALEWHSRGQGFDSPWLHQFSYCPSSDDLGQEGFPKRRIRTRKVRILIQRKLETPWATADRCCNRRAGARGRDAGGQRGRTGIYQPPNAATLVSSTRPEQASSIACARIVAPFSACLSDRISGGVSSITFDPVPT